MKRFLFFILIVVCSCHQAKQKWPEHDKDTANWKEPDKPFKSDTSHTSYPKADSSGVHQGIPWSTHDEAGYYEGTPSKKLDYPIQIDKDTSSMLGRFLLKNLSTKDIIFLNKETLGQSAFIDAKKKIRIDTLRNKDVTIISKYWFGDTLAQKIYINGHLVRDYKDRGIDSLWEYIFALNGSSFLHFSFHGREYYFLDAGIADCGASSCAASFNLLYDVKNRKLNDFLFFRVDDHVFWGDINADDKLDFLEINNDGYGSAPTGVNSFTMKIYSCDTDGKFRVLKDRKGKEYYINGNSGTDWYVGAMYIDEKYWPVKIKEFN